jgi:hypothetical protein
VGIKLLHVFLNIGWNLGLVRNLSDVPGNFLQLSEWHSKLFFQSNIRINLQK